MQSASLTAILAAALAALTAAPAEAADTLRCGGRLIERGASMAEVESRCGDPDAREIEEVPIRGRGAQGAVITLGVTEIQHWIYEREAGQFPVRLTFEERSLQRIEYLTGD